MKSTPSPTKPTDTNAAPPGAEISWLPERLKREVGQFNIFRTQDFVGPRAKPVPFSRKDYYKISLIIGPSRYYFADKVIDVTEPALVFTNPLIPYKCEHLTERQEGAFCIFTEAFFAHFGSIKDYPVFAPHAVPIFFPLAEEVVELKALYERLFLEIKSEYPFKYDLIRAQVLQLMHLAMKMRPAEPAFGNDKNANTRLTGLFSELLERQFPIDSSGQRLQLRMPADFAAHLAVHVNHLNRTLKVVTGQTTSQLLTARLVQEASALLTYTDWPVADIGYCLGFEEPSHFASFFKKHTAQTPNCYRKAANV